MRTSVAHAPRSAQTDGTRRSGLSVNLQFNTYQTRNSVQTTGATTAIRDLVRAREDAVNVQRQVRHRLSALLLRNDIRYAGKTAWT
jgi:hypothetical protein